MNAHLQKILNKAKHIRREDYAYLFILFLFFVCVTIVFSLVVSFFSSRISELFSIQKTETIHALDIERYTLTIQKLGLALPSSEEALQDAQEQATTTEAEPLDKQSLTIKILNSTTKKGVAAELRENLTQDGFLVVKAGNQDTSIATTTLFLTPSKQTYENLLLEAIRKKYPEAIASSTTIDAGYDAVIIIGEN